MYLGLGSNLGDRRAHLSAALTRIGSLAGLVRTSPFYESDPVGFASQPRFLNAVVEIRWGRSAPALLAALKKIERSGGRIPMFPNGPRAIDCDILDFGGRVARQKGLVLPHPRLHERRFALAPLAALAPRWRHPILNLTARELLARLLKAPGVRKIRPFVIPRSAATRNRPS
ncbi:MAG: 2-amino-4-hydroxy-6-hydroxymethyldihydropteridine diphosphokinase [Thermoanaerobaculia bacterium]